MLSQQAVEQCITKKCSLPTEDNDKFFCHTCRDLWREMCDKHGMDANTDAFIVTTTMNQFVKRYNQ